MSTISKINLASVDFDIADKEARQGLLDLAASIGSGQSLVILPSNPADKEAEYEGKYGIYVNDTIYANGKPLFKKGHVYYSDGTSWTDVTVANEKIIYNPNSFVSLPIEDGEYSVAFDPYTESKWVPSDIAAEVNIDDLDADAIMELGLPQGFAVITVIPKKLNSTKALLRLEVIVRYFPAKRETKHYSRLGYIDNSDAIVWLDETSIPSVTVDSALDSTSENPVQNAVVTAALSEKTTLSDVHGNLQSWLSVTDKSDFLRGVSNYSHRNSGNKNVHYGKFGAAITSDNNETIPANSLFRFTSMTTDSPMSYPFVGTLLDSSYEPIGTLVIRADSTADGNGQLLYYPNATYAFDASKETVYVANGSAPVISESYISNYFANSNAGTVFVKDNRVNVSIGTTVYERLKVGLLDDNTAYLGNPSLINGHSDEEDNGLTWALWHNDTDLNLIYVAGLGNNTLTISLVTGEDKTIENAVNDLASAVASSSSSGGGGYELLTPTNGTYTNGYLSDLENYSEDVIGTVSDWESVKGVVFTVDDSRDYWTSPVATDTENQWKLSVTNSSSVAPNTNANVVTDRRKTFTVMKDPGNDILRGCISIGIVGDRGVSRRFSFNFNADGTYTITCPYNPKTDSDGESDTSWYILKIYSVYLIR